MNYCPNCGNALINGKCPACNYQDKNNIGFNILCFFFPFVGLFLYILWKDEYPVKAKGCGKSALTGFVVCAILIIIIFFITTLVLFNGALHYTQY